MVQGVDMDNAHKIPQPASPVEDKCDPKKIQQPKIEENKKTAHPHDNAAVKTLTYYNRTGVRWVRWLVKAASKILAEIPVQDVIREIKIFMSHHPLAAAFVASVAVACGIPIFIFVAFAVITILFTFGGFIIIEGAVLAAGSFALVVCLATMVIAFITVSFFAGLLYVTFTQIDSMVRLHVPSGEPAQPFDSRLPQVLASLRNLPNSSRQSRVRAMQPPLSSNNLNGHVHTHNSK
ncbi:uncharacterized protein LOC117651941 [Thrips palmi]|uniref:Uncharacterized protein LOC117651941 n=1 Tax=Thrips palmi TaxID=161013 RepID=A0A6P9A4L8_THRPL|nr:uncharacterized protein LOC117651941 [Thrips palmi]